MFRKNPPRFSRGSSQYTEPSQASFRAVQLRLDDKTLRFETGDPIIDWWDMCLASAGEEVEVMGESSSVGHFFMDGDEFAGAYLNLEKEEFVTQQDAYSGAELRDDVLEVISKPGWDFADWKAHLQAHGRFKKQGEE